MAFDPGFLDELRARVPLGELIGRRVRLVRRGRELVGLCPFHHEKTPSFTVVEDKGFYHCFGCGAHGDAIGFAMQTEGVSFPEAVERLAAEVGLPIPVTTPEERAKAAREATLHGVMEEAAKWFEGELASVRGETARAYLARRGLDEATIARFRLGYAPDTRSALKSALTRAPGGEKIEEAQLVEAGLLIKPDPSTGSGGGAAYDRFRGRVIFPIGDARGRIIAFGGRVLGEGEPKYLNSPDTPLFHKGRVLYNLANAREAARKTGRAIVAEGYMDVIALARAGFAEAVAPLGTALTETHLEMLWRLCPEPILCFDGDAAGRRAAARAADRALPILKPGQSLRFALLPAGEDPDSLLAREGRGAVDAVLDEAWPLDRMLWEIEAGQTRLDTPERVAGLEKRLEDRANHIADRKVQYQYLASFRTRLREEMWRARGRRPGGRRTVAAQPMAAAGARTDPAALARRQEQSLLACLINHPDLLDEFAEPLGQIELSEASLDKVRQEILRVCGQASALDSAALRLHLRKAGLAEALATLEGPELRAHDGFARAGAPAARARMGLVQVLARYRRGAWRVELDEAERAWLENQNETNWARWQELFEASKRAETDASALDDDEFAAPGGTQATS
jgi:DNA primase